MKGGTISPDKRRLAENFLFLSVLQFANYIFPLITMPYLWRVLGPAKFGLIAFAQAFVQFFIIITDYGFNLSATRKISIHRDDKTEVSRIFSSVLIIKLFLTLLCAAVLLIVVMTAPRFRQDAVLYFFSFGMVAGNVLFPVWFFQGMERMKYITALNFLSKLIFTAAIFIFVKRQSQYMLVPVLHSLGFLTAGFTGVLAARRDFGVRFIIPCVKAIVSEMADGWHIFISTVAINLYSASNTFILGLIAGDVFVGYYSIAEKIIKAVQSLVLLPVSQAIYPYVSKLAHQSADWAIAFVGRAINIIGLAAFFVGLLVFIFAMHICVIIQGGYYEQSVIVLRILAFIPFITALSNIFGIQTMLTFNMKEAFSRIILSAGILNVLLVVFLAPLFMHIGAAVSLLITEIFVTVTMFSYLRYKDVNLIRLPLFRVRPAQ